MITIDIGLTSAKIRDPEELRREPFTVGTAGRAVMLSFSSEWAGLAKTAVFVGSDDTRDVVVSGSGDEVTVIVPHEVTTKPCSELKIGIYGVSGSTVAIPTVYASLGIIRPGADPSGDPSIDPTPEAWEQIVEEQNRIRRELTAPLKYNSEAIGSGIGDIVEISPEAKTFTGHVGDVISTASSTNFYLCSFIPEPGAEYFIEYRHYNKSSQYAYILTVDANNVILSEHDADGADAELRVKTWRGSFPDNVARVYVRSFARKIPYMLSVRKLSKNTDLTREANKTSEIVSYISPEFTPWGSPVSVQRGRIEQNGGLGTNAYFARTGRLAEKVLPGRVFKISCSGWYLRYAWVKYVNSTTTLIELSDFETTNNPFITKCPPNATHLILSFMRGSGDDETANITDAELEEISGKLSISYFDIEPKKYRVLAYNAGNFSNGGTGGYSGDVAGYIREWARALGGIGADIAMFAESRKHVDSANSVPASEVYGATYRDLAESNYGSHEEWQKALACDANMAGKSYTPFGNEAGNGYESAQVVLNGNRVLLVAAHLFSGADASAAAERANEIASVISFAETFDNVIIGGDLNTRAADEDVFALLRDAGYSLANNGKFGVFNTSSSGKPLDNICAKGNIFIKNAYVVENVELSDHKPLVADIVVY